MNAAAKHHGWTEAQRTAALAAIAGLPASLPVKGKPHMMAPVPVYDIACEAAAKVK